MDILITIILTLIIYSMVATAVFIISDENETVGIIFGIGIIGWIVAGIFAMIRKARKYFKYYYNKRSIFQNRHNGQSYTCRIKYTNDVTWNEDYKLIKRYAAKSEWESLPEFSKTFLESCKINCDRCKYHNECNECLKGIHSLKCVHDEYGAIISFDKFEAK